MSLKLNSRFSMGRDSENNKILELWCILLQEYKDVSTINMSWNDIRSILDLPNLGN
jgi:hypothetical protein